MNKEVIDYKSAYENVLIANNMLRKENKELHNKIDKAIEYIEEHTIEYKEQGKIYATEFDFLTSPYYLLSILKDSDVDE